MNFDLEAKAWFQMLQRLPRPLLSLSLCTSFAWYAWTAALRHPIDLAVFAALGTAAGVDVIRRGVEKYKQVKVAAQASVEAQAITAAALASSDAPDPALESSAKPDVPA